MPLPAIKFWKPTCKLAAAVELGVYACPLHDPVLEADCSGCGQSIRDDREQQIPRELRETKRERAIAMRKDAQERERTMEDTLREMGFTHLPAHAASASRRQAGRFVSVRGAKEVPIKLCLSKDLLDAVGMAVGSHVDIWYAADKLAILVGSGDLIVRKDGATGLSIHCPTLLEKLGLKPGQRFAADVKGEVIFTSLKTDAPPAEAAEGKAG